MRRTIAYAVTAALIWAAAPSAAYDYDPLAVEAEALLAPEPCPGGVILETGCAVVTIAPPPVQGVASLAEQPRRKVAKRAVCEQRQAKARKRCVRRLRRLR